jgi:uncharacterized protein YndB with AHSA1/START domain
VTETNDAPIMSEQRMVINRVFDAPRSHVWKAWTDPQTLAGWWGPKGFDAVLDSIVLEPRVGGVFKLKIFSAEYNMEVPIDVVYTEVVENERIAYTEPVPCHPDIPSVVGTVTFKTVDGDKTEVNFDVVMETYQHIKDLSQEGWIESFDKLDALFANG